MKPNKEIKDLVTYAETLGFTVECETGKGHLKLRHTTGQGAWSYEMLLT